MCKEEAFSLPSHDSTGCTNTKDKQLNKVNTTLNGQRAHQVNEEGSVLTDLFLVPYSDVLLILNPFLTFVEWATLWMGEWIIY